MNLFYTCLKKTIILHFGIKDFRRSITHTKAPGKSYHAGHALGQQVLKHLKKI